MQVDRYLRLALMLNNNQATTLRKNLEKMISLVLYDAMREPENTGKSFEGLEVVDIIERLSNSYGLDFSESEIFDCISNQRKPVIIDISQPKSPKLFTISPEEEERIKAKVDSDTLDSVINDFVLYEQENIESDAEGITECLEDEYLTDPEKIRNLLYRYFYTIFNSNASYIKSLLGKKSNTDKLSDSDFHLAEKNLINDFVYWDNPDKDRFVYEMVSCCFDYCMMTAKKDTDTYKTIFNNKVFYLDTNVIFRLIGINRENRQKIISAFVNKCHSANIELKVTNFTRTEIEESIGRNVGKIRQLLGPSSPIDTKVVYSFAPSSVNPDFYQFYKRWCDEPGNTPGDYSSFEKDLNKKALGTYTFFKIHYVDSKNFKEENDYSTTVDSLIEYKHSAHKNSNERSAEIDVSNYLYVRGKNAGSGSTDFFNTHHYLISADHAFGDWARERVPNSVPVVVLPSVWYSIILQYGGRNTDDDYAAFTRFLNFSLRDGENYNDVNSGKKLEILKRVLELKEPAEIKTDILFNIQDRFKDKQDDADDYSDVDAIVEEGLESVTEQVRKEERRKAEIQRQSAQEEYRYSLKQILYKHEDEINNLKINAEHQKDIAEAEKEKAVSDTKSKYIKDETDRRARITTAIYWIITIALAAVLCFVVFKIFNWIQGLKKINAKVQMQYDFFKYVVSGGTGIATFLIVQTKFCNLDYNKIWSKVKKKVEREHNE